MKFINCLILFTLIHLQSKAQNYTKEQTIEYINQKMKIADPVFDAFKMGDNGEVLLKWVNDGVYTEYRFNIRELEFNTAVNDLGDNIITLTCNVGFNNCLQRAYREDVSQVGDKVNFKGFKYLDVISIGGFHNVLSVKNALVYLKVLSISDNVSAGSNKRDPFLN